jgi:hypothetical protein
MRTPDSHRIRTVGYGSPPPDPIEPQTSCMCEGYILRHWWHEIPHSEFSWITVFLCESGLPQTPFIPWTSTVWMVQQYSPAHTIWGRCRNAFWMPTVNECRQIDPSDSSDSQRLKRWHSDPSCRHFYERLTVDLPRKILGKFIVKIFNQHFFLSIFFSAFL